jgi:DUF971 family protein
MDTAPDKIEQIKNEALRIIWSDGERCVYPFRLLRQICPCAVCKDEWTGERLLDPESVPKDLTAERAEIVGNYALSFKFSDGHTTGVYTFEMLRKSCPDESGSVSSS